VNSVPAYRPALEQVFFFFFADTAAGHERNWGTKFNPLYGRGIRVHNGGKFFEKLMGKLGNSFL
jgi:hypothetical protein